MLYKIQNDIKKYIKVISVIIIAIIFILYLSICGCIRSIKRKPNILFIISDDHAISAINAYGGFLANFAYTPNLDQIAEEGILFYNCFATNAICAPSRATILTGKYSHLNGVVNNSAEFDGSQHTFPKLLQEGGYETAMIGKWHLKSNPTGFDYWNILPGQGQYYNPVMIELGEEKKYEGYVTDIVTDQVLKWLQNRKKEKPFFLMWNPKAPHRPWMPDTEYLNMYDTITIPEPNTLFDDYSTRSIASNEQKMSIANDFFLAYDLKIFPPIKGDTIDQMFWNGIFERLNEEQQKKWEVAYEPDNAAFQKANIAGKELIRYKYQRYIKDYLRTIASLDENIGRVLEYLNKSGLTNNTIIIYTSDQGFFLGEHGWFDKRFMYEESIHMPLLVRFPGEISPGLVNNDMVTNLDFAPTILEYAGIPIPDDMQGRSIRPLLKGKTPEDWRTAIYYHYYEYPGWHMVKRHYGLRTERYKLIHFYYDIDAWELYDLEKDPKELINLYNDSSYDKIVKELISEMNKIRKKFGDSDSLTIDFIQKYPGNKPDIYR